ncbi:hypothetical protein DFR50_11064 [Roseiarcus fermentans]|uniref:Uncharacterized protein n=1 Tax=Roseiarcus fermentans TaxID=1473586 RepID=A0A366FJ79_9HYPH|nr:sugar phosphorylase [Roseiarcus fermentans]RBP14040.1 hypothetical protein DFR50_11064 [Roseiarcus fermentans]
MTLAELFEAVKDLPPETPVCVAEIDEAAGANVDGVEVVRDAKLESDAADATEAVEFGAGADTVVVLRW